MLHALRTVSGAAESLLRTLPVLMGPWLISSGAIALDDVPLEPLRQYPTGLNATGVVAADLDGDGDIDLALSNRATDDITIRFNNGEGMFPDRIDIPTGEGPRYVDAADFDGDGDIDLCTPDYNSDTATVLRNDGNGQFTITHRFELHRTVFLWTDDLDLDGNDDMIVLQWDGTAEIPSQSPALMTPFYGTGTGDFETGDSAFIGLQPRGGASADLDGDGRIDIVTANLTSGDLTLLLSDGDRTWRDPVQIITGGYPRYLTLDDLDGDGDIDITAVSKDTNECWILHNDGTGDFSLAQTRTTNNLPHSIDSGDMDGDGDIDVIVSHVGSYWSLLYLNNGSGYFPSVQWITMTAGPAEVELADLDGDGLLDIASANVNHADRGLSVILQGDCIPGADCNQNGIRDRCEVDADCNRNGLPDSCELDDGTAQDLDGNGVLDDCQDDCNGNGLPDGWEISVGMAGDCNGNQIPDDCDWNDPGDCDGDGIINGCEADENHDHIPDDCQCYADLDGNESVDVLDLLEVLSQWGTIPDPRDPPLTADFDFSESVDIFDFLLLLNRWGDCPPPLPTATGACCTSFGPCITMTEIRCELTLGTYLGDGVDCNGMECPELP